VIHRVIPCLIATVLATSSSVAGQSQSNAPKKLERNFSPVRVVQDQRGTCFYQCSATVCCEYKSKDECDRLRGDWSSGQSCPDK